VRCVVVHVVLLQNLCIVLNSRKDLCFIYMIDSKEIRTASEM
jgi:hypothetical protein